MKKTSMRLYASEVIIVVMLITFDLATRSGSACGLPEIPAPTNLRLLSADTAAPRPKDLLGISLPAGFTIFSPDSPWNTPVPADAAIHPDSDAMIARLAASVEGLIYSTVNWTIPLFVIDAAASPTRSVTNPYEALHPSVDPNGDGVAEDIPLPDGIWADPQTDGHLAVLDPVQCKSWELSRAKRLPDGNWQATRVYVWDLDGPGYDPPFSGSRWWMRGARGGGMPLVSGLVRPEDIQSGEIKHALAFAVPEIRKSSSASGATWELCSPVASRTDGQVFGYDTLPYGVRIQLDPSLDLDSLGLSKETKVIAKAMQVYGMFLADGADNFKVYFQNLGPDRAVWAGFGNFDDLWHIPVNRFRVLGCNIATKY